MASKRDISYSESAKEFGAACARALWTSTIHHHDIAAAEKLLRIQARRRGVPTRDIWALLETLHRVSGWVPLLEWVHTYVDLHRLDSR